jgi:hypothetical protein
VAQFLLRGVYWRCTGHPIGAVWLNDCMQKRRTVLLRNPIGEKVMEKSIFIEVGAYTYSF